MSSVRRYLLKDVHGNILHVQTHAEVSLANSGYTVQEELDLLKLENHGESLTRVVDDIEARDNLIANEGDQCWVLDASDDGVEGAAKYICMSTAFGNEWARVATASSMNILNKWSSIEGRPFSSPLDIDNAVSQSVLRDIAIIRSGDSIPSDLKPSGIVLEPIE